ncbi:hypothetical protein F4777DRAFT_202147 [Nemania sp. FL0916]|nr:hypothetical protein F4777DRAFT_202147 [Nemania sp. FL0916]
MSMEGSVERDRPLPSELRIGDVSTGGGAQSFVGINYGSIQYTGAEDPQKAFRGELDRCLNALFLTDPYIDRESLIGTKGKRTAGTCEWIRENDVYKSWLEGDEHLLWISGGPGKGKTMLSIFLTEELERLCHDSENAKLLFYFCNYQDEKRNNAVAILRGLLHEILRKRPNLGPIVLPSFKRIEESKYTLSSASALWGILKKVLESPDIGKIFCVVDGLDECDERSSKQLIDNFTEFFSSTNSRQSKPEFKLVIVSRPEFDKLKALPRVKIDPDNDERLSSDIENFISSRVKELSCIKGFNEKFSVYIKDILLERSEGTFLWVGFVMDELARKKTATEIQETLEKIPKGLHSLFDRMLHRIKTLQRQKTLLILHWVMYSAQPLTLQELAAATGIHSSPQIDAECITRDEIILCDPILKIHKGMITFVHQSAKEYLSRIDRNSYPEFWITPEEAHLKIARRCLELIENSALRYRLLDINAISGQESSLLRYAILQWPEHARCSSSFAKELMDLSRPFFQPLAKLRQNWAAAYFQSQSQGFMIFDQLLHGASYFGIVPWIEQLLLERCTWQQWLWGPINVRDGFNRTPLNCAIDGGHHAAVQLLLNRGANVHATEDERAETGLMLAAQGGDPALVQLLLDYNARVNKKTREGQTALMDAARQGHTAVAKLLLDHNADVLCASKNGHTALMDAARKGHTAVAKLLLDHNADVNAENWCGETGLTYAARYGYIDVVRLLLDNGADVNQLTGHNKSAVGLATNLGHKDIAQLLLSRGADLKSRRRPRTILFENFRRDARSVDREPNPGR